MARHIDRKLRLTAAVLGMSARKDLAAAFRRVNAQTPFDVVRADKWLQGRAQPREQQVYEDWSKVLGLDRPGQWIADSDLPVFIAEICSRHGRDPESLQRDLELLGESGAAAGSVLGLSGSYVCYSHAWSPYYRGRLIRGELDIAAPSAAHRSPVTYVERLPTGPLRLKGTIVADRRALSFEVRDGRGEAMSIAFCLFPPSPPASVLAGMMFGATVIGPEPQPSMSRVVMLKRPPRAAKLRASDAYLAPGASMAEDLARCGVAVSEPVAVDRSLAELLAGDAGGSRGVDQIPVTAYRTLADLFDRDWLAGATAR